jgi:acyl dehydratase
MNLTFSGLILKKNKLYEIEFQYCKWYKIGFNVFGWNLKFLAKVVNGQTISLFTTILPREIL